MNSRLLRTAVRPYSWLTKRANGINSIFLINDPDQNRAPTQSSFMNDLFSLNNFRNASKQLSLL